MEAMGMGEIPQQESVASGEELKHITSKHRQEPPQKTGQQLES